MFFYTVILLLSTISSFNGIGVMGFTIQAFTKSKIVVPVQTSQSYYIIDMAPSLSSSTSSSSSFSNKKRSFSTHKSSTSTSSLQCRPTDINTGTGTDPDPKIIQNNKPNIDLTNYDFSSKKGWDSFYEQEEEEREENVNVDVNNNNNNNKDDNNNDNESSSLTPFQFEWHSSIDLSSITSLIPKGPNKHVLLAGNGNSDLPKLIHDSHHNKDDDDNDNNENHDKGERMNINITCVDYSQPCIDMLRMVHDKTDYPNMDFICGDATDLVNCIQNYHHPNRRNQNQNDIIEFDVIVDKGLMDAMMCDEGWNASLDKYFQGASMLLKSEVGKFILLSYKLSASTKEYLSDMGDKYGIEWDFDIVNKSNSRVSFSVGMKL